MTALREKLDRLSAPFVSGECREWLGAKNNHGYGVLRWRGRSVLAHRAAWEDEHGSIPHGLDVLHSCDNPPCISGEHLFLGTHAENMADSVAKGRFVPPPHPRGERHYRAKLTRSEVLAIRADPRSDSAIAAAYGVAPTTVYDIKHRKSWAWLKAEETL